MKKPRLQKKLNTQQLTKRSLVLYQFPKQEKAYLYMVIGIVVISALVYPYAQIAMWVAFFLAGYSAIANDSIQTVGTFISSNIRRIQWYYLWLFMGGIFVATILYSWFTYGGDISYERLHNKGLDEAPSSFSFLQLFAPLILLIMTRMRMPVSTSILLLSAFSTQASTLGKIIAKSFLGYIIAFFVSLAIWYVINYALKRRPIPKKAANWWYYLQWIISGTLWSVWIMQDMANFAVVLPRSLSVTQLCVVIGYIFFGLGLLFYLKGDKIQRIVDEKTNLTDVRVATILDLSYMLILYYLKIVSKIPISTTWVFIGLLGGREIGLSLSTLKKKRKKDRLQYALRIISKDIFYAGIGLLVSILLAISVNEDLREAVLQFFP